MNPCLSGIDEQNRIIDLDSWDLRKPQGKEENEARKCAASLRGECVARV